MRTILNIGYLITAGILSFLITSSFYGLRLTAGFQAAFFASQLIWLGSSWLDQAAIRRFEDAANRDQAKRTT